MVQLPYGKLAGWLHMGASSGWFAIAATPAAPFGNRVQVMRHETRSYHLVRAAGKGPSLAQPHVPYVSVAAESNYQSSVGTGPLGLHLVDTPVPRLQRPH